MRHCQLPYHLYVNVENRFLGSGMPEGVTYALWHGVYSRPGQLIMAHVMLETGAHWSGLPLHAISTTEDFRYGPEELMPWYSMGNKAEAIHFDYLEGLSSNIMNPIKESGRHTGMMLDWSDGYSRYPQEHKPLNLINLSNGQFALIPNNFVTFTDNHFVTAEKSTEMRLYRRNEKVYWEG